MQHTWERTKNVYKVLIGKREGKDHWEELDVDGRIILKCILEKGVWTGFIWLRIDTSGRLL
jgi:hypothetical protein